MADLNGSNGTCQGRKSVLDSTSRNCSVSELQSIFNLNQAIARIERDVQLNQFAGTSQGQCCLKQLRKSVSDKLSKFCIQMQCFAQVSFAVLLLATNFVYFRFRKQLCR